MIRNGTHLAETDEEKQAVYRLRYDIYVDEMGRAGGHEDALSPDPERLTA